MLTESRRQDLINILLNIDSQIYWVNSQINVLSSIGLDISHLHKDLEMFLTEQGVILSILFPSEAE